MINTLPATNDEKAVFELLKQSHLSNVGRRELRSERLRG